jgi:predicted nucleic acid-binding protein
MTPTVVIDTNVFVSALLGPRSANRETLRECLSGRFEPLMGAALFSEYEAVLSRDSLFRQCALNRRERSDLLDAFII